MCLPYFICTFRLSLLHGAQATRTNINCFAAFQLYLADVGLPSSVGFAMRVRNVLTEHNALTADTTFCHFSDLLKTCSCQKCGDRAVSILQTTIIIPHIFKKSNSFFRFFYNFFIFLFLYRQIFSKIASSMPLLSETKPSGEEFLESESRIPPAQRNVSSAK